MKILVISLAGIGDTIFATPLIHELRENFPDAAIDVLIRWGGSKQVLEGNPYVNSVYRKDLVAEPLLESLKFLRRIGRNGYDFSLNVHPQSRVHYRAVARFIGAKTRISHDYDHANWFDRLLVNRTLPQDYSVHCVENDLAFLPLLGAKRKLQAHRYEIFLSDAEEKWARDFVYERNLSGRKLLGIHVGTGATKNLALRRWPLDCYIQLIEGLTAERRDLTVLLFGGPEEREAHAEIFRRVSSPQVLQPESRNIRQAAALIKRCNSFLSVDTSLMHMAAAVRVPGQLVIETPTFNKTVEPFGQSYSLIPNPAVAGRNLDYYRYDGRGIRGTPESLARCMKSVTVESVRLAVLAALGKAG